MKSSERPSRSKKGVTPDRAQKRLHVLWAGRVHGVGFRYTAESAAMELRLLGWVRNQPDGRVEAVCEGPETALKGFLERIATGPMQLHIRQTIAEWSPPQGEFDDFRIRFY